jgi:hypothetical protein
VIETTYQPPGTGTATITDQTTIELRHTPQP